MKLSEEKRAQFFELARSLSPNLGALFQNPMDITPEDLNQELDAYYRARNADNDRWLKYHAALGELLCFQQT